MKTKSSGMAMKASVTKHKGNRRDIIHKSVRAFGNFRDLPLGPEIKPPDLGNIRNIFPDSAEIGKLGDKSRVP
jgi:hypothetical protein